ncbi:MAG: hypothetical protein H0W15_06700 [Gemmatimonadales bacterium]|nr:hypothetical protein [Gemmatimonadales bacterium]
MSYRRTLIVAALTVATVAGCSKNDSPDDGAPDSVTIVTPDISATARVAAMELGRAVDSMKNILGGVTSNFGANDTLYLSVRSENTAPGSTVAVRWMNAAGETIDSTAQQIAAGAASAAASTEFHIKKATAWPEGKYQVEVFLDNVSQGIKEFEVKH